MRWLKREMWKASIALAGMLLLLLLIVWILVSAAGAYEGASGLAPPGTATVQATPTVDATVAALSKEQLTLQVKQLQDQLQNQNSWWVNNSTALIAAITAIVVALIGFTQWAGTARQAKDKDLKAQAEERFKTAVAALGDEKESVQVGGAILLRSFLHKEDKQSYEQYYTQVFDLAVAYLRLPRTSPPSEDPTTPLPLTTLSQALSVVFKEAFPLARERREKRQALEASFLQKIKAWVKRIRIEERFDPQSLDATGVQLDHTYLVGADLERVWMPVASLRGVNLIGAKLVEANLSGVDLRGAVLSGAGLRGSDLSRANLSEAVLSGTGLRGADLREADFSRANLSGAYLRGADLSGAKLVSAQSLEDTDLRGVKGLTKEQLATCKAKGAIIDEELATSSSTP